MAVATSENPKVEKKAAPQFTSVRFLSEMRGCKYVVRGRVEWNEKINNNRPRRQKIEGKYLVTDGRGETAPVADPEILKWYLAPTSTAYRYEMVCLWPGEKPRAFGTDVGETERKRLSDLIAYLEKGGN